VDAVPYPKPHAAASPDNARIWRVLSPDALGGLPPSAGLPRSLRWERCDPDA
jgi:hypothetical protein